MPRDGSNIYSQPFPDVITDTTVESLIYNGYVHDITIDLNAPRPILAGGTAANNARDAMINLSGEIAKQVVSNYDMQPFVSGSFYSLGSATAGPVEGHAFVGICYLKDDNNIVLEARDQGDTIIPGRLYIREKKAGVWGDWTQSSGVVINDDGEVVLPPVPDPVDPDDATNKAYVDAGDTTNAAAAAAAQATADAANANANNRVLRSGDTMTGALSAPYFASHTSAYYFQGGANWLLHDSGMFTMNAGLSLGGPLNCGAVYSTGTSRFVDRVLIEGAGQPVFAVHNTVSHQAWGYWVDTGPMIFGYTDGAGTPQAALMTLNAAGNLGIAGQGTKPGGGDWAASSDVRIKNVLGDFDVGLDDVAALRPVRYTYKGNDTLVPDGTSPHKQAADAGTEFIGLVAQEAEATMPELVDYTDGYIDSAAVTDLRTLDTTPLIFALINCVKELKARVEALESP